MTDPLTHTLRRAYRASGLTIPQIAARAQVSEGTVWAVLAGRQVHTGSLFRVCLVFDLREIPVPVQAPKPSSLPNIL